MVVCTLGDLTLDVVVRLDTTLAPRADTTAAITLAAGGQAANVAAWVSALGGHARFIGKRGTDEAARFAASELGVRGVEIVGPAEGRGGVICSVVEPGGERSMLSDRGAATGLRPDELDAGWLDGCDHLFVSGYALFLEPARSAARAAVAAARERGAAVSVDLASWSGIRDTGPELVQAFVVELGPDLVFANQDEERTLGGRTGDATWIVKRGGQGCRFGDEEREAPAVDQVVDTTGAGDALAAGYILGGPDLALEAAARCVQQVGAMPTPAK
jgi:sugar/nucleoside kinase (ribokinase family)